MARDVRNWMWAEALDLLEQAERVHRAQFRPGPARHTACWEPLIDLFEAEGELWIQVALPGVKRDQLEVTVAEGVLSIAGERPLPLPRSAGTIHRLEEFRTAASSAGWACRPAATSSAGATSSTAVLP